MKLYYILALLPLLLPRGGQSSDATRIPAPEVHPSLSQQVEAFKFLSYSTDVLCMAEKIVLESRGEPLIGQVGVAWVIKNRGENYCEIVSKRKQFARLPGNYSFEGQAWETAKKIAWLVDKGFVADPTNGADHFHSKNEPYWGKKIPTTVRIKNHHFHRSD